MEIRMDGRVAVITGASTGLGLAMAREFVASGASVAMLARRQDVLDAAASEIRGLAAQGARVAAIACDVSKPEPIAGAWERIVAEFGAVDILVNNAGVSAARPFESSSDADWQADLDLKLFAAIRLTRLVLPGMRDRGWGRIINVASALGLVGLAGRTPYTASKGAVLQLTRTLALETAADGITVNALCPGPFLTEMNRAIADTEQTRRDLIGATALGRWGRLEEIQAAALFLASPGASYVTGAALPVDGGWTAR